MSEENKNLLEKGVEAVGNAVVSEVKDTVTGVIDTAKTVVTLADKAGDAIGGAFNWLTASSEERAAIKAAESAEKAAAEAEQKRAEEEAAAAEAAEEQRLEELKDTYILHSAMITCSFAVRPSRVQIPISHGAYIHGIDQLNVGDSKPIINIQTFGVCTSPANPSVQAAAAAIMAEVKERKKGFIEKVMDIFCKSPEEEAGADLVKSCAGVCTPLIFMPWIDGKEDVLIDGEPALLGRCTLTCGYDGAIAIYTDGVCEEMMKQVEGKAQEEAGAPENAAPSSGGAPAAGGAPAGQSSQMAMAPSFLAGNIATDQKPNKKEAIAQIENKYAPTPSDISALSKSKDVEVLLTNMDNVSSKGLLLLKKTYQELENTKGTKGFDKILKSQKGTTKVGKDNINDLNKFCKNLKKEELITQKQLIDFGWHDTSKKEVDHFNKVLKEYGITDKKSITMFMATVGMESGKGKAVTEDYGGDLSYFNGKSYSVNNRGAGYIQITGKDIHKAFLKEMKDPYSGIYTTKHIAKNYPLEASAWYWSGKQKDSKNLNKYTVENNFSKEVFLITQYFVNGYVDGIDPDLNAIKRGAAYSTVPAKKGEKYGKLFVNGRTWRTPKGWEDRGDSFDDAKKAFYN